MEKTKDYMLLENQLRLSASKNKQRKCERLRRSKTVCEATSRPSEREWSTNMKGSRSTHVLMISLRTYRTPNFQSSVRMLNVDLTFLIVKESVEYFPRSWVRVVKIDLQRGWASVEPNRETRRGRTTMLGKVVSRRGRRYLQCFKDRGVRYDC